MELLELLNEDGSGTGLFKRRADVHHDGDMHACAHVWLIRNLQPDGNFEVLLQQRSLSKDAYPGCLDTSCAGHVKAGETYFSTAVRELDEELGVRDPDDLIYMFDERVSWEDEFHGKRFINREYDRVYTMISSKPAELFIFNIDEVMSVCWQDAREVLSALKSGDKRYCVQQPLFERLMEKVASMRTYTIHIGDFASVPGSDAPPAENGWKYHETYEYFGTEEGANDRAREYVSTFREDVSPYLSSVTYWLT
jgi:isopentenyldiphosphate isomerase